MAACLWQQFQCGVLPIQFAGIDQHHSRIGTGCSRDHVARVLLMPRRIANDEFALFGGEIAVSHINGDALFAFGRQTIGQECQVCFTRALHACQLVLQHSFGVHQQATNQRTFAIVHTAAGDEFQGSLYVLLCVMLGR